MDIRVLPSNIANMIAAGEVIQRPASVVKELVENAVDAGATRISVFVRDAGRTLVQVTDNGCGMTPDEAVLCFQRHATSKIVTAEDLQTIETFGFRGEALASIAAVAEVTLTTRTGDAEVATRVTITDATSSSAGHQDISQTAGPVGSSFAIRNLYYNTPARRKFLKSDASELKAIVSEFIKIALSRPDIAMSLVSDEKEMYRLGAVQTLKFRVRDIFSETLTSELLSLSSESAACRVEGFVARPDSAKKTVANQYLFVNGRYFRSPYLHKAIMQAYQGLIPEGTAPSYFIFIDLDPRSVDVNVHPTKTEIKFEDDNVMFTVIMAAVRQALGRSSYSDLIDFDGTSLPTLHNVGNSFDEYRKVQEPFTSSDSSFNPFDGDGYDNQKEWETTSQGIKQDFSILFDETQMQEKNSSSCSRNDVNGDPSSFVQGRFIVHRGISSLILVDAIRAAERIYYEEFLSALSGNDCPCSSVLFPIEVEISPEDIPLLEKNNTLLKQFGFDFSVFSQGSIAVNTLPEGVSDDKMSVASLVYEIVTSLQQEKSPAPDVNGMIAAKIAACSARRLALPASSLQADALLDKLFKCETPDITPSGRRITVLLDDGSLAKLFK